MGKIQIRGSGGADRRRAAALAEWRGAGEEGRVFWYRVLRWPSGGGDTKEKVIPEEARNIQAEMEEILGKISGVGEVRVMLTEDTDGERRLARNMEVSGSPADSAHYSQSTEAVMEDSGGDTLAVVTQTRYPSYRGALVVCQGGDRADVRLAVTEAVSSLTGLSADRIAVAKWQ